MASPLSRRLAAIVDALPLRPGLRVLEIGCGPGAALREVVQVSRRIADLEGLARIEPSAVAEPALAGPVSAWASGASLAQVLGESELTAGDFVRWCKQLLDVLHQLADLDPQAEAGATARLARQAARAAEQVNRGVVGWSSL